MIKLSRIVATALVAGLVVGAAWADDDDDDRRFRACANGAGAGLFWIDSTTGALWWAGPASMKWQAYGKPAEAKPGPIGTYVLFENRSGPGVFVLNTDTGQGWWANKVVWRYLGEAPKIGLQQE